MALPVEHEALEQVGAAQERRVGRRRAAHDDMVAAAGAGVAAVGHELVGAEPALARVLVDAGGDRHRLAPALGRMHVDLDHAGVGRHLDQVEARIDRRSVALDMHRRRVLGSRALDRLEQLEIILELLGRRHEHADDAVARLDRDRRAHRAGDEVVGAVGVLVERLEPVLLALADAFGRGGVDRVDLGHARLRHARRPMVRQGIALGDRVRIVDEGVGRRRHVRQRVERQAEADRRVAGRQEQLAAAELPALARPARLHDRLGVPALHRQHEAGRLRQPLREGAHHPAARLRVVDLRVEHRDVGRQLRFLADPGHRVLVGGQHVARGQAEVTGDAFGDRRRLLARGGDDLGGRRRLRVLLRALRRVDDGDQRGVVPDRLAVAAPVQRERPARQRFARVPLALAVMQHAARREAIAQPADQLVGEDALGLADRVDPPFQRLEIVDRDEGRLAAHRQADVLRGEVLVDLLAQPVELLPRRVRERRRDARRLGEARDLHVEGELAAGRLDEAGDRRRGAIVRRRADRQMALAAEQAGGGVEPEPAGAGDVHLGPGVQVGEVLARPFRPLDGIDVGHELDQVAGDEPRGEADVAGEMDEQPGRVAAGAGAARQRLLRGLHAGLHAHLVADRLRQAAVQGDEVLDGPQSLLRQGGEIGVEGGALRLDGEIRCQLGVQLCRIGEWAVLGVGLGEEVERVEDRQLGDEVDLDLELARLLREDEACQPVAERVLLPIDEMVGRRHLERIARHVGPAMRRGTQSDRLRPERDGLVVGVVREVRDAGRDRQGARARVCWEGAAET